MKSIEQEWQGFARAMMSRGVPQVQYDEMRAAFYGGAVAMIHNIKKIGEAHVTEKDGLEYMDRIWKEAMEFAAKFKK